jgi:peptide-methionine (R)-S-oxide reductase
MTPHQYWVAKGRGMEAPFTGEYWFVSYELIEYE